VVSALPRHALAHMTALPRSDEPLPTAQQDERIFTAGRALEHCAPSGDYGRNRLQARRQECGTHAPWASSTTKGAAVGVAMTTSNERRIRNMDKDRIEGAAKQVKGSIKETAGKVLGDAKLTAEGKSDKVEGKIQNVIGSMKDALKQ